MKKINWKLLSAFFVLGLTITASVLIGLNWDYLLNFFDNATITVSFLITILINFITIINNSVSVIIKVFVVKNEKKKQEMILKQSKIKAKILDFLYKDNLSDFNKIKGIKEILKNED